MVLEGAVAEVLEGAVAEGSEGAVGVGSEEAVGAALEGGEEGVGAVEDTKSIPFPLKLFVHVNLDVYLARARQESSVLPRSCLWMPSADFDGCFSLILRM